MSDPTPMTCPNCDCTLDPDNPAAVRHPDYVHSNPNPGHSEGCMLRAFLVMLNDREEHALEGLRLEPIDIDAFWDHVNPITDWLEDALGLSFKPATMTITRVAQARCDDCGQVWPIGSLKEPEDLHERLEEGGEVPSGECPDCGALAYPVTKGDRV